MHSAHDSRARSYKNTFGGRGGANAATLSDFGAHRAAPREVGVRTTRTNGRTCACGRKGGDFRTGCPKVRGCWRCEGGDLIRCWWMLLFSQSPWPSSASSSSFASTAGRSIDRSIDCIRRSDYVNTPKESHSSHANLSPSHSALEQRTTANPYPPGKNCRGNIISRRERRQGGRAEKVGHRCSVQTVVLLPSERSLSGPYFPDIDRGGR